MKTYLFAIGFAASAFLTGSLSLAQDEKLLAAPAEFMRNPQIIVHYTEGNVDKAIQAAKQNGLQVVENYAPGSYLVCERDPMVLRSARAQVAAIQTLSTSDAVEVVEPNYVLSIPRPILPDREAAQAAIGVERAAAIAASGDPNDPRYNELWGLRNARAPEVWTCGHTESAVVVAVIDTGVDYTHEDLAANMWRNSGETGPDANGKQKESNGKDDDGNGFVDDVYGYDFANRDGDPMDDNEHGTHCAGTIGAVGDNMTGVVGFDWKIQIMAVKFLDASGSGSLNSAVQGIDYARLNGARVLSNSWGTSPIPVESAPVALRQAIERARDAGILFVAAAGNDSHDNDSPAKGYPASYDTENIISVAAIDSNEEMAWFSSYGERSVDLGAPGVRILSTFPDNKYEAISGTSMATPHVSGAAALILGHPDYAAASYESVRDVILKHARLIPSLSGKTSSGGTLDVGFLCGEPPSPPVFRDGVRIPQNIGMISSTSPDGEALSILLDNMVVWADAGPRGRDVHERTTQETRFLSVEIPYSTEEPSVKLAMVLRGFVSSDETARLRLVAIAGDSAEILDLNRVDLASVTSESRAERRARVSRDTAIPSSSAEDRFGSFEQQLVFTVPTQAAKPVCRVTFILVAEHGSDAPDAGWGFAFLDSIDCTFESAGPSNVEN